MKTSQHLPSIDKQQRSMSILGSSFCDGIVDNYKCQCPGCKTHQSINFYMVRLFIMGFLLPLFWLVNITIYIHYNWFKANKTHFPMIHDEILFTEYELQIWKNKSVFTLNKDIADSFYKINNPLTSSTVSTVTTYQADVTTQEPTRKYVLETQDPDPSCNTKDLQPDRSGPLPISSLAMKNDIHLQIAATVAESHKANSTRIRDWFLRSLCGCLLYTSRCV